MKIGVETVLIALAAKVQNLTVVGDGNLPAALPTESIVAIAASTGTVKTLNERRSGRRRRSDGNGMVVMLVATAGRRRRRRGLATARSESLAACQKKTERKCQGGSD